MCFLGNASLLLAQSPAYTLDVRSESIADLFDELNAVYGMNCTYDPVLLGEKVPIKTYSADSLEELVQVIAFHVGIECIHTDANAFAFRLPDDSKPPTYLLKGRIFEESDSSPLASANIVTYPNLGGTYSDAEGNFSLEINGEVEEIWVQFLGYEVQKFKPEPGKSLDVSLKDLATEMNEVVICHKLPLFGVTSGAIDFSVDKIKLLPRNVGMTDVLQSIQYSAGVSSVNDGYGNISIRGSHSSEALVLLDDIPVIQLDHYFGLFSALPSDVVDQATLYKRHTPSIYGSKSSGLLDLASLKNKKKDEGAVYTGLLGTGGWLNVNLDEESRSQFVFSARTSNGKMGQGSVYDWMSDLRETTIEEVAEGESLIQLTAETPTVRFYDLFAKFSYSLSPESKISMSAFQSAEQYDNSFSWLPPVNPDDSPPPPMPGGSGDVMLEEYAEMVSWKSKGIGLTYSREWSTAFASDLMLSFSRYERDQSMEISLPGNMSVQNVRDDQRNLVDWKRILLNNNWTIQNNLSLDFGAEVDAYKVDAQIKNQGSNPLLQESDAFEASLFGNLIWNLGSDLSLQTGLRASYYDKTDKLYWQPRVLLEYHPIDWLNVFASYGTYYQYMRQISHEDRFGQSRVFWVNGDESPFPVLSSRHYNLGFDITGSDLSLMVELYQKNVDGVSEFATNTSGFDQGGNGGPQGNMYRAYVGQGLQKGVDFTLRVQKGRFANWLSYTLSSTEQRFKEIDRNNYFPAANDRRHQLKFATTYSLMSWNFTGSYVFASGAPYTDISNLVNNDPRDGIRPEDRLSYFDDFHRLNLSARYDFKCKRVQPWIETSVYNVFDHQNVNALRYVFFKNNGGNGGGGQNGPKNEVVGAEIQGLGRTLNLQLGIAF